MTGVRQSGVIGRGLVVHGRVVGAADLRVEGRLEGDVTLEGALTVGPAGWVQASVRVRSLHVSGTAHGTVEATEEVVVTRGGVLHGDVRAPSIGIEDGGDVHGAIVMDFELGGGAGGGAS